MGYMTAIKTAILIFPLVSLLFTFIYILHQYHKYGSINRLRTLIVYSFILYMLCIYFLVILPLPKMSEVTNNTADMMRLIPFSFVADFIRESSFVWNDPSTYLTALTEPCFYTVAFNILMTVPFGMYLRYYFECDMKKTVGMTFGLSLFFEITQLTGLYFIYPHPYRLFDVDDLLMNTLGGLIGYLLASLVHKILPSRKKIDDDSLKVGMRVSPLRRFTSLILDIFIYALFSLFGRTNGFYKIIFLIYFILIPIITGGQTLGQKIVQIRLVYSKSLPIMTILRTGFLILYYYIFPVYTFIGIRFALNYFKLDLLIKGPLYLILFAGLIIFYLGNFLSLFKNKKMFYDDIFQVRYESTIEVGEYENG